jgi:hypothetical protein
MISLSARLNKTEGGSNAEDINCRHLSEIQTSINQNESGFGLAESRKGAFRPQSLFAVIGVDNVDVLSLTKTPTRSGGHEDFSRSQHASFVAHEFMELSILRLAESLKALYRDWRSEEGRRGRSRYRKD